MSNDHGITAQNLLSTLPNVLRNDENMLAIASATADLLAARPAEIESLMIYTRINTLPETLLDILAYDFKVDWYDYDYEIDAKRALLRDSFAVHRRLGTRGAVEKALSGIYPGSEIEEWFQYNGNPFFFRVILDVTKQRVSITHAQIVRAINIYKSIRSHLEDDAIIYRSRVYIGIGASSGYVVYATRLCGTYPVRAMQGGITKDGIILQTDSGGIAYSVPISGIAVTGRHPATATQGGIEAGAIDVGDSGGGVAYSVRYCGSAPGNLI